MDIFIVMMTGLNLVSVIGLSILVMRVLKRRKDLSVTLYGIERSLERMEKSLQEELAKSRAENGVNARGLRDELANALNRFNESVLSRLNENAALQLSQLESFAKQLGQLTQRNEQRMDKLRDAVEGQLKAIQQDNTRKLDEMRKTVDEKLNDTLEKRLGESFRLVSERLELVHKGLGEMQSLALGVGDLKRVLTNVKTRGIWGEMQLGNILEQVLTVEQYAQNVVTRPGGNERVEYAIKLPGRDKEGSIVWLPIDAKFPQEDYQRLQDAQEQGDFAAAEETAKALENRIKAEAKDIAAKYICVPDTTDFAILFLPIEGLYAEVLRRPGLCDILMREYKVIVTGPTTLAALLNSLQMGFRTLAIEKRSSEVWGILGAVKSEFGKFGILLDKTHKKLQEASNSIDNAARKSRTIQRKLKDVQELPQEQAVNILGASGIGETFADEE
ncbi:DNA recombination protein RmuC|uniref:DNA recombination protein RmuC n=1 Tax=Dendrosporobacter quercicolus TaxID=146817 RepID=A0A1G9ZCP3_9FIRM|nr:DNA recombination protein RmuC [Dendrosporobacter quercicolus]NSL49781.1 DNA recombination protein RmuC [Dendrosporobacter quercicolus DSM 1736]SDN19230.1 DNA recombination protein RmuC [Dendrosporobacter quercicolus]